MLTKVLSFDRDQRITFEQILVEVLGEETTDSKISKHFNDLIN